MHRCAAGCGFDRRFIPAYTGNAPAGWLRGCCNTVYPRVYGECSVCRTWKIKTYGLSPRIRGMPFKCLAIPVIARFIPAYTGNASLAALRVNIDTVYPRVYGECLSRSRNRNGWSGLSPRIRGMRNGRSFGNTTPRFIPAYTGNATEDAAGYAALTVYPRVYGECLHAAHVLSDISGLSPRIRGMLLMGDSVLEYDRFIPAYTGNARRYLEAR